MAVTLAETLYLTDGYGYAGSDKAEFYTRATLVFFAGMVFPFAWWLMHVTGRTVRQKYDITVAEAAAVVWTLALLLSYLFSDYRDVALWGTRGWFMGLLPELMGVAVFFLFDRVWKGPEWAPLLALAGLAVNAVMGIADRFGAGIVEGGNPSKLGTIGNMNWYCGYLVMLLFIPAVLLLLREREHSALSILCAVLSVLSFEALMIQGSASGELALGVGMLALWALSCGSLRRMRRFAEVLCLFFLASSILFLACRLGARVNFTDAFVKLWIETAVGPLGLLFSGILWGFFLRAESRKKGQGEGTPSGNEWMPKERFGRISSIFFYSVLGICAVCVIIYGIYVLRFEMSPGWGSNRGATWFVGLQLFLRGEPLRQLFGAGPDAFYAYLSGGDWEWLSDFSGEVFSHLRLTNAHNEYLSLLVNTGLLGMLSFAALMGSSIFRCMKAGKKGNTGAAICAVCLLAYTANGMVSFRTALTLPIMYLLLGLGEYYLREERTPESGGDEISLRCKTGAE
ncbi:MAG: O-antigen ligase family protein [Lachnospiraceae bacterium]|nr:O-antigen ligase family protein [Lachnospiraceae bacterium]